MREMFRSFLMACVAILIAASLTFAPSNAAAMQDCASQDATVTAAKLVPSGHSGHEQSHSTDMDQKDHSSAHPERHCASHTCVVALTLAESATGAHRNWLLVETLLIHDSLIALATPDGLRRPPRG